MFPYSEGVVADMYLMDWHLSLFSKCLPLEVVVRLWDIYLSYVYPDDGEIYLLRLGLGLLQLYATKLLSLQVSRSEYSWLSLLFVLVDWFYYDWLRINLFISLSAWKHKNEFIRGVLSRLCLKGSSNEFRYNDLNDLS